MKQVFINDATVRLSTASENSEFYAMGVTLPEALAVAILEEQRRKFELSDYLAKLREAGRTRTDPTTVPVPSFLEVTTNAEEPETKPKPKRGRPPRVSK